MEARIVKTNKENCHNTLEERLIEQDGISYKAGRKSILDEAFNKMKTIEHRQITIKKKLSDVELIIQQARQEGIKEVVEFLVKDGEQGLLANLNKLTEKYGKPVW